MDTSVDPFKRSFNILTLSSRPYPILGEVEFISALMSLTRFFNLRSLIEESSELLGLTSNFSASLRS
jgi:hypothetical protein